MRTELKLPLLGDVMVEGTLAAWLKDDGATVARGEPLYQLETDKVSYAVEAPASGVLKHLVAAGETVPVGTIVGAVLDPAELSAADGDGSAQDASSASARTAGDGSAQGSGSASARTGSAAGAGAARAWTGSTGESAGATGEQEADGDAGEVRASPAARRLARQLGVDIAALPTTRRIRSEDVAAYASAARGAASQPAPGGVGAQPSPVAANERSQPPAGSVGEQSPSLAAANEGAQPAPGGVTAQSSPAAADNPRTTVNGSGHAQLQATPAARRLARERGVTLPPSARLLRVEDVEALLRARAGLPDQTPIEATLAAGRSTGMAPLNAGATNASAGGRTQPMTGRRKVIADRMHASLQTMAQLTISMQVDVTEALRLRTQLAQLWGQDARPTITDLVGRAAVLALGEHPELNATLTDSTLTLYDAVHLGLAVDTPDGLIVPVVHNASGLPLQALAAATRDLANRARENRLGLDDVQGGTFTVTTLGALGVDFFTPIINPPQVAILGIGRTFETLTLQDGKVESHSAMHLSLSFDHRAVDGTPAARFLGTIKRLLELPVALVVA